MIMNKVGAGFEYNGKKYVVGESIVGTDQSEYDGLLGSILEIRDGEDKDTENETPDIYCSFEPPALPYDIQELEQRFSKLYGESKKLEDIILDEVIMAPEMIEPLRSLQENKQKLSIYIVHEDWAVDGESGHSMTPFVDYRSAKLEFCRDLAEEQRNGCIHTWEGNDDLVVESGENFYECYMDGDYCVNHYKIFIEEHVVLVPDDVLGTVGRAYTAQCMLEDFISQVEGWNEIKDLTDEQYKRMVRDTRFSDRLQKALEKNDYYWESYWETVSEVAHEFINEYLKENTDPDCYTPEPDNPYPLCIGNGKEECRQCCLYVYMEGEGGYIE